MQNQLVEEKEKVAHVNEQLQQEQSKKEQELKEIRDAHLTQISSLQEKITNMVSICGTVRIFFLNCLLCNFKHTVFHLCL